MSLEILGSRVLAPHYGSSVYVWGSLITTFLTALAVGYWLGGRLADYRPHPDAVSLILACAAVLILPAVAWGSALLSLVSRAGWDVRWSALAASLVLFLPSSLALGMVSPFAVRISASRLERVGSVSGGFSALSAFGSILGTLLMAFVLIPAFGVPSLLLGLAPSVPLPLGRSKLAVHFDVDAVLANWDGRRSRPLELAALQYDLPGPWAASEDPGGADTSAAIRVALDADDREAARRLAEARLREASAGRRFCSTGIRPTITFRSPNSTPPAISDSTT